MKMFNQMMHFLGIRLNVPHFEEVMEGLYRDFKKRNMFFHLVILLFEGLMAVSISLKEGGPFLNPRRTAYFVMYMILIVVTGLVLLDEVLNPRKQPDYYKRYFAMETAYIVFFCAWCVAVTLNDQLGGNGLTVYTYVLIIISVLSMIKPWQAILLYAGSFCLLNALLPFFPDPSGLDQSYNNMMNSLFITLASLVVSVSMYHARIKAKLGEILLMQEYERVEKQSRDLQEKVFSDALTGLLNRFSYDQAILRFQKEKLHSFSCVYLDVNGLHEINNRLGHEAGDAMLKTVAQVLLRNFRSEDVFRIGGDEFVILCGNMTKQHVEERSRLIREQVRQAGYSVSLGAEWRDRNFDIHGIIRSAEMRMLEDKESYYAQLGRERTAR